MHFIWLVFSNFTNIRYLFLSISAIYAKDNKALENWGYSKVYLAINDPLNMQLWNLRYFHFSSINMTFVKHFMEKLSFLRRIFKILPKFYCLARFCDLVKPCSKITVFLIFFEICPKGCVLCLVVFVNWRNMVILDFLNLYNIVGTKAKWRTSKWVFQENKARQIFRKTNISHPLIRTRKISENLAYFVFLRNTRFEIRPFALLPTFWHRLRTCLS